MKVGKPAANLSLQFRSPGKNTKSKPVFFMRSGRRKKGKTTHGIRIFNMVKKPALKNRSYVTLSLKAIKMKQCTLFTVRKYCMENPADKRTEIQIIKSKLDNWA